jgi:hypothetical protein
MNKQNFDVDNFRVASPCSVGWETMSGDERVRRCHSCELNIYNISEMTKTEVENLITKREGRICIRLYKRADGTVLTKDCPVGFRAYQKRAARFAGAALATILGLFSVSFGQKEDEKTVDASKVKISRTLNQSQKSIISGIVRDMNDAIFPAAKLKLYKKGEKKPIKLKSDADGHYIFKNISVGIYTLEAEYKGFTTHKIVNLEVKDGEAVTIDIELQPSNITITVGIYAEEPLIDRNSSSITTKFTRKQIENLPY